MDMREAEKQMQWAIERFVEWLETGYLLDPNDLPEFRQWHRWLTEMANEQKERAKSSGVRPDLRVEDSR